MTEIATRPEQVVDTQVPNFNEGPLVQWAREASAANSIAKALADTPFVPESFRGNAAHVTAAILVGQEVGLQPMAALRSIDIVQGTPAMRAVAMRALVQSHGHDIWPEEQTETRCVMAGRRSGGDKVVRVTWTMDRAKALGVAGRPNYQKQPGTMLIARATSELCRLIAADVLLGIPYSAEELDDGIDLDGQPVAAQPEAKKRTARRAALKTVPVAPAAPAEPDLEAPPAPAAAATDMEQPSLDGDWPEVARPPDGEAAS